jgi:hypothetical protein
MASVPPPFEDPGETPAGQPTSPPAEINPLPGDIDMPVPGNQPTPDGGGQMIG